jgi:atypical dual specificity phosphatase
MAMPSFLNQISRITDNLYLSSFMGTTEYNLLKFKITCVITACRETPKVNMKGIEAIKLDVQDKPTEFLAKYFDFIADKINEVIKKNGIVLVHCVAGISRSTSMILAYLMKHKRMRLKDAHSLVRSKRSFVGDSTIYI